MPHFTRRFYALASLILILGLLLSACAPAATPAPAAPAAEEAQPEEAAPAEACLLYTSDAADEN